MAKRKEDPPKAGAAWLGTFADLMNLLLCFFVLLFSMSTVNAQKFELIAASFSQSFSIFSAGGSSIGEGLLINNGASQLSMLDDYMTTMGETATGEQNEEIDQEDQSDQSLKDTMAAIEQEMLMENEETSELIEETLAEQDLAGDVDVDFTSQYIQLTLNGALLFDSGKADLKPDASGLLDKIGIVLQRYADSIIEVEGHTDNVPIHNSLFKNNNELSSARALTVFDYLVETTSLDPAMIKHSGRGEYCPVADNSTPEGRAKNRRVEIKIYQTLSDE